MNALTTKPRPELGDLFRAAVGVPHVYFQEPDNVNFKMKYPCVVYTRIDNMIVRASNGIYGNKRAYRATLVYKDPDSDLPDKMMNLPYCKLNTMQVVDGLYQATYTIYF